MKICGVDPKAMCNEAILVLPRGKSEIVFRATGLRDDDDFIAICPQPKPPGKTTRDGFVANTNDPTYQQVMTEWGKRRFAYMLLRSLAPSNIEWDTVQMGDPRTWTNWERDLKEAGLTQVECNRVAALVLEANALDEEKLNKARESFLAGQEVTLLQSSGQVSEQETTPSGVPVNG